MKSNPSYFEFNEKKPHFEVLEFPAPIEVSERTLSDSEISAFRNILSRQSDNKDLAAFRVLEVG